MIPIDPRMAAMAYMQSAGNTRQSSARRYWQNRFNTGGPRVYSQRMEMAQDGNSTGAGNVTGPGGVMQYGQDAMAPIAPFAPTYPAAGQNGGAPTDLMGLNRYLPGVGPRATAEAPQAPTVAPTMGRVASTPLFEQTQTGRFYDRVKRGDSFEAGGTGYE